MSIMGSVHEKLVFNRRVQVLTNHLLSLLPPNGRVLDVGCGDGMIDTLITQAQPGLSIEGIDVLVRPNARIPVTPFDGKVFPFEDDTFDSVMFVDVLHHTLDPSALLHEAARVCKSCIVLKDHLTDGFLAEQTLRFMDWVGNAPHGVNLPYNYWPKQRWLNAFGDIGAEISGWNTNLSLYPFPANWLFDRGLHFVTRLNFSPP